ncbi:MAG: anthranilate phosphoribosyltransferase [Phycicoccus sp.]|nr:anthranilate phosphoribosyltransferase [Phycicoccus sp.]
MLTDPGHPTWPDLLTTLTAGHDLSADEVRWAMGEVMAGEATAVQLAGFLIALRAKGESISEIHALADTMLEHGHRIVVPGPTIDVVGTGGDRQNTVNISTMSAIVVAAAGVRLVKHGNRAASSSSGSADVLEALGVSLDLTPDQVQQVALDAGITFCFARTFHPSMRFAAEARAGLGVGTAFNLLGPLTNPAQPDFAAVGVADPRVAPLVAGVFAARGTGAMVFRGRDGLDELTVSTESDVWWVRDGAVSTFALAPESVGVVRHSIEALRGGDTASNAAVVRAVLRGEPSAAREAVLLNAGAALATAAGTADGSASAEAVTAAIARGVREAAAAIDTGAAQETLTRWVEATQRVASA